MTLLFLVAVLAVVAAFILRQPGRLAELVPVCEVKDSVVLTIDGGLAAGFVLEPLAYNSCSASQVDQVAQSLATLIRRLADGTVLQLIVDVQPGQPPAVGRFVEASLRSADNSTPAGLLCRDVAMHAQQQVFRTTKFYVLVSLPYEFQSTASAKTRKVRNKPAWTATAYERATKKLEQTAAAVRDHVNSTGLKLTEASEAELLHLVQSHLNPGRNVPPIGNGQGRDPIDDGFSAVAPEMRERPTLRESLCATHFETPTPNTLVAGETLVRTISMKALPDATFGGMLAPLFFELPAPGRMSVVIEKLPTELTLAGLKLRRSMALSMSLLSTSSRNIDAEVQRNEIESVMASVSQSAASFCAVQLTCAIYGKSVDELERRVAGVEQAFARSGGIAMLVEDHAHLDAYLAMLPGAAHRFRRQKTVIDVNAAQMLVPFTSWKGSAQGPLLLRSRTGDAVLFDPFDPSLPAYNGLVVGGTGSGKSFVVNQMGAQLVARGGKLVVIDIGGSYRHMTSLWGGTYIEIGRSDSVGLNPLCKPSVLAGLSDEGREQRLQFTAGYLELLLSERGQMPTSERALISKMLAAFYSHEYAASRWESTPTLTDIQKFLLEFGQEALDRDTSLRMARRLDLWTRGPRARLFERPIDLSLAPPIIAIDLKPIEGDKELQAVALYVLSFIIWDKVAERNTRTMVVFDECWALLSNPAAMRLIENLVRTLRKYGAGLWCLSQSIDDFASSQVGPALLNNSYMRILLRHASGHERVAEVCRLPEFALAAFRTLTSVKGRYSEALFQYGEHAEVLQIVPSPLAYWMATTDKRDRDVEAALRQKNPTAAPIKILSTLAERLPRGAQAA